MNHEVTWNDALTLSWPDGFHVMDDEERAKLNFTGNGPVEAIIDPDRHITVTVGWKQLGGLSSMLLNAKDAARNMEAGIRRPMQAFQYRAGGFISRDIGGQKAEGFSYEYETQGIGMYGESFVVKHNKAFYYLHLYTHSSLKQENLQIWNEILSSVKWQ